MARAGPPFRADQVGSLLRSRALAAARARRERNEITAQRLKAIEDEEIRLLIEKQEAAGLQSITDGEYRRAWWHFDFMERLQGVEGFQAEQGIQFHGTMTKPRGVRVVGKIGFGGHPFLEHFKFLKAHTTRTPKMTIPGPPVLHFRLGRRNISTRAYPDIDLYFDDLGKTYRKVVQAFYDAGCRYLQLDDTVWAYLCSKAELQKARDLHGNIVDRLPEIYARTINDALAGKPADMMITTHVCRGNFRSTWVSEGGYEPVAELLFGSVNYDGYFLEYDTDRAGDFAPLRFLPKGRKRVVLGLVTSKSGALENRNDIKRRIDEATKHVALDQCCLSPQCGFASTEEGNLLSEEEQWAKLRMIVEIAKEVWD
jgi:5-methyltetrahydropteroyltriglutamate--homocysteine methyltransferase